MPDSTLRVYVDARPVDVPHSAVVIDAIEAMNAELATSVRMGQNRVTDSRGLPISADAPLHGGAILRVVPIRNSGD